ncbi:MAG TPA: TonB family protein [Rhizomicrobium sp.]
MRAGKAFYGLLACLVFGSGIIGNAAQARAYAEETYAGNAGIVFDVSPQPLVSALEAYSRAAKIQILYDSAAARGLRSPGVNGLLAPQQALEKLLEGTGLFASYETRNSVVLLSASGGAQFGNPSVPLLTLGSLKVDAQAKNRFMLLFYEMYARLVQEDIRKALSIEPATRALNYSMRMMVWVGDRGSIERSIVFGSSGDHELDEAVLQAVHKVAIDRAPPFGMPQPIHVRIFAQNPS